MNPTPFTIHHRLSERSLVFPILLFSSISLHCSLKKAFLSLLAILLNSAFKWVYLSFLLCLQLLFSSQLLIHPLQTAIFPFAFLFLGDGLNPCLLYNVMNLCPCFIRHSVYLDWRSQCCLSFCLCSQTPMSQSPFWCIGI